MPKSPKTDDSEIKGCKYRMGGITLIGVVEEIRQHLLHKQSSEYAQNQNRAFLFNLPSLAGWYLKDQRALMGPTNRILFGSIATDLFRQATDVDHAQSTFSVRSHRYSIIVTATLFRILLSISTRFFPVTLDLQPLRRRQKRGKRLRSSSFGSDTTEGRGRGKDSETALPASNRSRHIAQQSCERLVTSPDLEVPSDYVNTVPPSNSPIVASVMPPTVNHPESLHQVPSISPITNQDDDNIRSDSQHFLSSLAAPRGQDLPLADITVNTPHLAVHRDIQLPESAQINAIMQQIDNMWAAIARLRQSHLERTAASAPVSTDRRSEISSSLPDYASVEDPFAE
ncbi:uncharacterized protein FOMMEDRAFT_28630 [Fomitiporia mediterranea MF3/22]|uniref:uncharacterized protein n=1 Tax=Fomitiporia mediterranea (strain MF3/22) TaxID=694068 RepID=UPI000440915E|nr:uncharacterized protein FOMMEDRAFT_28630 [Fomitiporia mediterranea MF3/22]EJD03033.1 hypothetical protein FOMMEDRAFT_28630 [Fomitiporia mediterranea MF3/22]